MARFNPQIGLRLIRSRQWLKLQRFVHLRGLSRLLTGCFFFFKFFNSPFIVVSGFWAEVDLMTSKANETIWGFLVSTVIFLA